MDPSRGTTVARATLLLGLLVPANATPSLAQEEGPSGTFPIFHLGVFANVDYLLEPPRDLNTGFRNGALDLYATSQLSNRWSALVELVFEQLGGELVTDLERLQVFFDVADGLRLTAGRLHNPLVRWNVTQHHGVYLQTPIDKPAMTEWEDIPGLWPVHFVGVLATGRFPRAFGVTYQLGVGNGRGSMLDEIQVDADRDRRRAVIIGAGLAPPRVPGLEVGVTAYRDDFESEFGPIEETDVTLSGSYLGRGLEVRGEWGRMFHELAGVDHETTGWYLLLSHQLMGRLEQLRPYVMYDDLDVAAGEAFLEGAEDQNAWIAGFRWDVARNVAVKMDYRSQRVGREDRDGVVRVQAAFSFN